MDFDSKDFKKILIANCLLIITTVLWGSTFILTKNLIKDVPIFFYLGLRSLIALIGFLPLYYHFKKINKKVIKFGVLSGIIYFLAIAFQTVGLKTTTAGKAGFITGLATIIVPFLAWCLYKKPINIYIWISVILSIIGMSLLMLNRTEGIIIGDILVLVCAFFCAIFVIMNDKYVKLIDIYLYSILQLIIVTALCFACSIFLQEHYVTSTLTINFWLIMIYLGIIVTTLTFCFQNWSQRYQDPSKTAIIFTLEPVFAVLFASFILGNEIISIQMWIGCTFIFIAIFLVVIKEEKDKNNLEQNHSSSD